MGPAFNPWSDQLKEEHVNMETLWKIADYIDLEYFLQKDESIESGEKSKKYKVHIDNIAQSQIEMGSKHTSSSLLNCWVKERRSDLISNEHENSVGEEVVALYKKTLGWSAVLVFIISLLASKALLHYEGSNPINISFIFFFVLLQVLLLIVPLFGIIKKNSVEKKNATETVFYNVFKKLSRLMISNRVLRELFPEVDDKKVLDGLKITEKIRKTNPDALYWPVFSFYQYLAIVFNSVFLGYFLFRVAFTDLAFAWQSTGIVDEDMIKLFVVSVSYPWDWALGDVMPNPSPEQIDGTKLTLVYGIKQLIQTNMASWWPFITMSVFFYGCFLRGVMGKLSKELSIKSVNRINFDSEYSQTVNILRNLIESGEDKNSSSGGTGELYKTDESIVLLPVEVGSQINKLELENTIKKDKQKNVREYFYYVGNVHDDESIITKLNSIEWADRPCIIIFIETFNPPRRETITFFSSVRESLGERGDLLIFFVGIPEGRDFLSQPRTSSEVNEWRLFLEQSFNRKSCF